MSSPEAITKEQATPGHLGDLGPRNDEPTPTANVIHSTVLRRRLIRIVTFGLLAAAVLPLMLWLDWQANHIVTRNAMVRGHLSEIGVRNQGVVSSVHVDAGDKVKTGQLLLQLSDSHMQAQKREAAAKLRTLEERLALERSTIALEERQAKSAFELADAELRRLEAKHRSAQTRSRESASVLYARRALQQRGAVSAEEVRRAEAEAESDSALAEAALAATHSAKAALKHAKLAADAVTVRRKSLAVLEAERDQGAAALQRVEADIASMQVRAPANGSIIRRIAQPGMAVDTGTPLFSMWLTDDTWIEAWVSEDALSDLQEGNLAQVSFPALPGERFMARISKVGLVTDFEMPIDYLPQSRAERMSNNPLVGVSLRLEECPLLLRPGISAVVDIERGQS